MHLFASIQCSLSKVAHAAQTTNNYHRNLEVSIITWTREDTALFQSDLLVSIDSHLQAAAQLLVHQAALAIAGAVRHEAGQVPEAHAVSTNHILTGRKHHRRRQKVMS